MGQLKTYAWLIIVIITALTVIAGYFAKDLRFSYDIESFFSSSDPELAYYHNHRETFENDNDFILIGITNSPTVLDQKFLISVDSLASVLKDFPRLTKVVSPTSYKRTVVPSFGPAINVPILHIDEPDRYEADFDYAVNSNGIESSFFSKDTSAVLLYIKKEEFTPKSVNDSLLTALEQVLDRFDFNTYHIAGRIKTQNYYVSKMSGEMVLFALISLVLLVVFLIFSFRCVCGVLLPIVVLIVAAAWTFGIIQLGIGQLDLLMTMLPTLLFVIGISTSVHILSRYIDELSKDGNRERAVVATVREMGVTTFLTSITTALGFASLLFIDIEPVQRFGLFAAIGIMITYVVSILLLPALLIVINDPEMTCSVRLQGGWNRLLSKIFRFSVGKKKLINWMTATVIGLSLSGVYFLQTNNHFLDDLSEQSSLKKDLVFFEDHFAGIRPVEIGIEMKTPGQSIMSLQGLEDIETLENYLRKEYGAGAVIGPATVVKTAFQALNGGGRLAYRLPATEQELDKVLSFMKKRNLFRKIENLITQDAERGRITGTMNDIGSRNAMTLNTALETEMNELKHTSFTITGAAHLMDNSNSRIAGSLLKGLALGFIVVSLVIGLLYGSFRIAFLSLLPNVLPLLVIAGIMGAFGIDLKVATAMIFTIAFGIAVDDTIHLLARVRLERKKGLDMQSAIERSMLTTGKAIIVTSFILSAGFLTFLLSDFQSTFFVGLLVSLSLLLALAADLFLLPKILIRHSKL